VLTNVSGVYSKDSVWTKAGSPYVLVNGGVIVAPGATLRIDPGVTVTSNAADIQVKGTLLANGVTFSGDRLAVTAWNGGRIDISASTVSEGDLIYASGSKGSLKNTTFSGDSTLTLQSSAISIASNRFRGQRPIVVAPDLVSKFSTSSFTNAEAVINVSGITATSAMWSPLGDVRRYVIGTQGVTVSSGTKLTIASGVTVSSDNADIWVKNAGTLVATGTTFAGAKLAVTAASGAQLDVSASTVTDGQIVYSAGSKGSLRGTTFAGEARLDLLSPTVTVSSNTFRATRPVWAAPDAVPKLPGNTFTGDDAVITVNGRMTVPVTWAPMGTVRRFDAIGVTIVSGTTLTVSRTMTVAIGGTLDVFGTLNASSVTFVGGGTLKVTGTVNIDCGIVGMNQVTLQPGSKGRIRNASLGQPTGVFKIANGSQVQVKGNDIDPTLVVQAIGTKDTTIDLSGNWWGVDGNSAVGQKTVDVVVFDRGDNANLPKISYLPALDSNGTGQVVPTLAMNQPVAARISTPYRGETWTFTGIAGQLVSLDVIDVRDGAKISLISPQRQSIIPNAFRDTSSITLPVTGIYTVIARGEGDAVGGSVAFQLLSSGVETLQPGKAVSRTFGGPNQTLPYSVTLTQAGVLSVTVDTAGETADVEVYLARDRAPTVRDYDYRSTVRGPDQTVVVPAAATGEWRVMLFTRRAVAGTPFTIIAEVGSIRLSAATPDKGIVGQTLQMIVEGAGFDSGTTFTLVGPGTVTAKAVTIVSPAKAVVDFPLAGKTDGRYTLQAKKADGSTSSLAKPVQVLTPSAGAFEARIVLPTALGRHQPATILVRYANNSSEPIPAPLLILGSSDPDNAPGSVGIREVPILSLDATKLARGFWSATMPDGFASTVSLLADGAVPGILQPGEEMEIPVTFGGLLKPWDMNDRVTNFSLGVIRSDDKTTIDWVSLGKSLKTPVLTDEAWNPLLANLRVAVGSTWGDFVKMLDANALYLGSIGAPTRDVAELLALEIRKADGTTGVALVESTIDASLPAAGGSLTLERTFASGVASRNTVGPFGYGWSTPWMTRLSVESDGDVVVALPATSLRHFHPDSRSLTRYLPAPGDEGALTKRSDGGFTLTEKDGQSTVFDTGGRVTSIGDRAGRTLTATWSGQSLVKLSHSSGRSLTIAYKTGTSLVESVTDSAGNKSTYAYDTGNKHLVGVTSPDRIVTSYTYGNGATDPHALTGVKVGDGPTRSYRYAAAKGTLVAAGIGGQDETTFTYGNGGSVTVRDATGRTAVMSLDSGGMMRLFVDGLGRRFSLRYDSQGRLISTTDARGRTTTVTYDVAGRVASIKDPAGGRTSYVHDAPFGDLSSAIDARGNATGFTYDAKGNPTGVTYADGTRETWSDYDAQGLPRTYVNGRGQKATVDYWPNGRLKKQTMPDGSSVAYEYDTSGNLTTLTDKTGVTTFRYDGAGRLASVTVPTGKSIEYAYDNAGRRSSMRQSDGFVLSYSYDRGSLDRIVDGSGTTVVDYDYDKAGRVVKLKHGNGTSTTYEYLADGRLGTVQQLNAAGKRIAAETYAYDNVGRMATMDLQTGATSPDGRWTYGYDDSGRLTNAVFVPFAGSAIAAQTLTYTYDAAGNRTSVAVNGVTTKSSAANAVNAIGMVGSDTLTYDKDGNLVARSGNTPASFTYDVFSRPTSMTQAGTTWAWTYNGLGHRVTELVNGARTDYLFDPLAPQAPVAATTNGVTTHYVGVNGIAAVNDGSGYRYLHTNLQGSATLVTAAAGTVTNAYAYRPFGETLLSTGSAGNPYRFLGGYGIQTEDNGVVVTPARLLSVEDGVFLSRDPRRAIVVNPNSYTHGDPLGFVDATGEWPDWSRAAGGLISSAVAGYGVYAAATALIAGGPVSLIVLTAGAGLLQVSNTVQGLGNMALALSGDSREMPAVPFFSMTGTAQLFGWDVNKAQWIDTVIGLGTLNLKSMKDKGNEIVLSAIEFELGVIPELLLKDHTSADGAIAASVDPNEKTGAAGVGAERWIAADATIPYEIKFENYGPGSKDIDANGVEKPVDRARWATAPAQQVDITDTFVKELDVSTFELKEIGFGAVRVAVPAGMQSFETVVPLVQRGQRLEVHVAAMLDAATRRFSVRFQTIDPSTQLPPSVDKGFLVPEDGNGNGMGFVRFSMKPVAGLSTGTRITNIATIAFDGQIAIATDQIDPLDPSKGTSVARQAFNTVDAGVMASAVVALPATTTTRAFAINWAATGAKSGTPVVAYDIYVREDDGPVRLWLQGVSGTSAIFQGAAGRRYAFYSRARDRVGNIEPIPATFDATTLVSGTAS